MDPPHKAAGYRVSTTSNFIHTPGNPVSNMFDSFRYLLKEFMWNLLTYQLARREATESGLLASLYIPQKPSEQHLQYSREVLVERIYVEPPPLSTSEPH